MNLTDHQARILILNGKLTDIEREVATLLARLKRSDELCNVVEASTLRSVLNNWRGVDEVSLGNPRAMADQLLSALDALAAAHGYEADARQVDDTLEKVFDAEPRKRRV